MPENKEAIIRTAANKKAEKDIIQDLEKLMNKWQKIKTKFESEGDIPQLLYKSPSIIEKIILDMPENKIDKIEVNDQKEYEEIKNMLEDLQEKNIKLEIKQNLLEKYELENQIEKSKQRKIWLNCGGFITIDATEALVAIDVNSGKFTGKNTLEETVYKVNYEATIEIARQLRLRDIGGIIIIDYIDMQGFTKLNLMELTRKHICSHNS